jgi:two-component system nitrate/nitrite response regulator NarL
MKVMIVDDHPLVRQGLVAVLSLDPAIEIVAESGSMGEALEKLKSVAVDVALIDLRLGDGNGLDLIVEARKRGQDCRFIILTSFISHEEFMRAVSLDISGYVMKEAFPEEVLSAIRLVSQGRRYYDPSMLELAMTKEEDPIEALTPREQEVLKALGKGMSNKEIAKALYITEYTVKKHVSQILGKLDLKDRTQAALYAKTKKIV